MKKSFLYPIVFMIIITAVFTFVLSMLNESTKEIIAYNQQTEMRKTLLYVFNIQTPKDTPKEIEKVYTKYITEKELGDHSIYVASKNGKVIGYGFPIDGNGLWGSIKGFAAVDTDFYKLIGLDFVSHNETPGLGGRITEPWFKEQFRGLVLNNNSGNFITYKPASDGNVDAIAGATLTSESVRKFINQDINTFIEELKRGDLIG